MTDTLIVMARTPRVGQGKSRLAREAGRVEAWRINRAMHAATLRTVCDPRWRTVLAVTPDRSTGLRLPLWRNLARVAQGPGDLGARMGRLARAQRGSVALIGTDCPDLKRADIARAFALLRRVPLVVGPALDGGFWIIAARRGRDLPFDGVRWSSEHTLADVLAGARAPVARLRTLRDVDTLADWRAAQR